MPGKLFLISFFLISLFTRAQNKVTSPFNLHDYENMLKEYLDTVKKDTVDVVFEDHFYFIKSKKDSLIHLKMEELKKKMIADGKPLSQITDKYLLSRTLFIIETYIDTAYFKIRKKGYTYFLKNNNQLCITTDKGIKIDYNSYGNTEIVINKNNTLRTWNSYYPNNGQLKRTDTSKLPSQEATGTSKEYDINGKLIFIADWDKEFKLTKEQAIKISSKLLKKPMLEQLRDEYKEVTDGILERNFEKVIKNGKISTFKVKTPAGIAIWHITFGTSWRMIQYNFEDKSQKITDLYTSRVIE